LHSFFAPINAGAKTLLSYDGIIHIRFKGFFSLFVKFQ